MLHIKADAAKIIIIPILQLRKMKFREVKAYYPGWDPEF